MKTSRNIIISAILTLGTAGSILAGSAAAIAVPASAAVAVGQPAPQTHFYV